MKRTLVILAVLAAFAAPRMLAQAGTHSAEKAKPLFGFLDKLQLTDDQKKQMESIRFNAEKQGIELRSRLALSEAELKHLLMADTPDKDAVAKKMSDVTANEAALRMHRINTWFDVNKILTADQQKEWRKALRFGIRVREAARCGMGARPRRGDLPQTLPR